MFSLDLPTSANTLLSSRSSLTRDAGDRSVEGDSSGDAALGLGRPSLRPPFDLSSQRLVSSTIFSKMRKVSSVCPVSLTTRSTTSCW